MNGKKSAKKVLGNILSHHSSVNFFPPFGLFSKLKRKIGSPNLSRTNNFTYFCIFKRCTIHILLLESRHSLRFWQLLPHWWSFHSWTVKWMTSANGLLFAYLISYYALRLARSWNGPVFFWIIIRSQRKCEIEKWFITSKCFLLS